MTSQPSQTVLDSFRFYANDNGTGAFGPGAIYLNGEIVPEMAAVPEPTTVALAIFGGIFGVVSGVRRYLVRRGRER